MIIYEVVKAALAMMGKTDVDDDYNICKKNALELIKLWCISYNRLYKYYCKANSISVSSFTGYTENDTFAYGEAFLPAASAYVAFLLSPQNARFEKAYNAFMKELYAMCPYEISQTVNKYPV